MAAKPAAKNAAKNESESVVRFNIKGDVYEIDTDHFTWGEVVEIEEIFDKSLSAINLESAKGTLVLAYLAWARKDDKASLSALKCLELNQIKSGEVKRPTSAPDAAGSPS